MGVYSNESRDRVGSADAHGFLFDHGELTRIDAPGAALTFLFDINDRGQVLGVGTDADNTTGFGFVRDSRGNYTRLPDVPGALTTIPLGFNNRGQIVGLYVDGDGAQHGYLLEQGRFTTIDVPGAVATDAFGINDRGQIVGAFSNVPVPPATSAMVPNPEPSPRRLLRSPIHALPGIFQAWHAVSRAHDVRRAGAADPAFDPGSPPRR